MKSYCGKQQQQQNKLKCVDPSGFNYSKWKINVFL